jgi:hypothetical protein
MAQIRAIGLPEAGCQIDQMINVRMATPITTGTKIAAILSTSFCTGALLPCASCTSLTICASIVSLPILSAEILRLPVWFIVAPITKSPGFFCTGTDSPVIILSSMNEFPSVTFPSVGIFSPGRITSVSPTIILEMSISFSMPFLITLAVFTPSPISFLIAPEVRCLALSSKYLPIRMKEIITTEASK